jgi:hypothetical protein
MNTNAIVEARKTEAAAERRVQRMLAARPGQKRYGVRSLAIMTLSRAALVAHMLANPFFECVGKALVEADRTGQ